MNEQLNWLFKIKDMVSPALSRINDNIGKTISRMNSAESSGGRGIMNSIREKTGNFVSAHADAMSSVIDMVPGGNKALTALANPYVATTTAVAGLAFASTKLNNSWEAGLAKINVTAQLSADELHKLSGEVLKIGERSLVPLMEVPGALDRIISSGLSLPASMAALEPTLKAAKAGFADIETTAAAAVSVMNSSGVSDVNRVYDVLFATLNKGNVQFNDIAQYLPKIIPAARQVGFSLEQVSGAFAFLTAQGQTAERSTTLLENAFKALGNPDRIKDFNRIGVQIFDTSGKMRPLVDIAGQLSSRLTGLSDMKRTDVLSSLGLDMEAASAFAALAQNVKGFGSTVDFVTNSQGQLNKAVANSATGADRYTRIVNKVQAIGVRIGQAIQPAVNFIMRIVEKAVDGLTYLFDKISQSGIWDNIKSIAASVGNALSWMGDKLASVGINWESIMGGMAASVNLLLQPLKLVRDVISWIQSNLNFGGQINAVKNYKQSLDNVQSMTAAGAKTEDITAKIAEMYDKNGALHVISKDAYIKSVSKKLNLPEVVAQASSLGQMPATDMGTLSAIQDQNRSVNEVSSQGGSIKNFTVNIQSLVKELIVNNSTNQGIDVMAVKRIVEDTLMRVVADVEIQAAK